MRRSTADIHAIIKGRAVGIEIKIDRDRMSEHHKERERITRAGGDVFYGKVNAGIYHMV